MLNEVKNVVVSIVLQESCHSESLEILGEV